MQKFINSQLDILNHPIYEMEFHVAGEDQEEDGKEQDMDYAEVASE